VFLRLKIGGMIGFSLFWGGFLHFFFFFCNFKKKKKKNANTFFARFKKNIDKKFSFSPFFVFSAHFSFFYTSKNDLGSIFCLIFSFSGCFIGLLGFFYLSFLSLSAFFFFPFFALAKKKRHSPFFCFDFSFFGNFKINLYRF
jgi:hypothetical protein